MVISNREIVERAYEALRVGDAPGFLGALDQQIVVHEPEFLPYGGTCHGLPEFVAKLPAAREVMDSSRMEIVELTAEEDRVAALLRVGVRGSEDNVLIAEHWRMRDGLAVELRVFWYEASLPLAAH
jgi:ketosteroid isomerase-like protein